ncbi:phosphatidylinositol phosphatase PTPRQ-like [Rhopilema esculentum]|uniref:phosphatidylinositol phosphatase PTPRQ-like n=1 Tax=Rhopilema esculentum TaxID=499914 RepID=UPI0031D8C568
MHTYMFICIRIKVIISSGVTVTNLPLQLSFQERVKGQCQSTTVCGCNLAATSTRTASSSFSPVFSVAHSGINNEFNATDVNGAQVILNGGSWEPAADDDNPWFQADFGSVKTIRKISTKGNSHTNSWIKEYNVYTKNSLSSSFSLYKKLPGNENADQLRVHDLGDQGQFQARIIKIVPLSNERNASLRIDFTGCDKVDGGWTNWEGWRGCRRPCGGGLQFRFRLCENPKPRFLGINCPGISVDQQSCNEHTCPPTVMSLELHLPSETWNVALAEPTSTVLCTDLKSNFLAVYVPPGGLDINVACTFYQWDTTKVRVIANITLHPPNSLYIAKLQDGLHYHQRIHSMAAILAHYSSTVVPYPPSILSFNSLEFKYIAVTAAAASTGPSALGYEIFYRLDTTDPDGAWTYTSPEASTGACDSFPVCYIWNTAAFHNYTARIIPFSGNGFGFGSSPYKVRARERPPEVPSNYAGVMVSSRSIRVSWSILGLTQMHGNSEGYQIRYKPRDKGNWQNIRVWDHWTSQYLITGLEEYVVYHTQIQAKNTLHYGHFSHSVSVTTDEDIPSAPPSTVSVSPASSTSLHVSWSEVPVDDKNGIIINYKINITLGTVMAAENSSLVVVENGNQYTHVIPNLIKWTFYTAQVAASTIKGTSVYSGPRTARTSEDRPDIAPGNFRGIAGSSTTISLLWNLIPLVQRHGVITRYIVTYYRVDNPTNILHSYFDGESTLAGTVTSLHYWTEYSLKIAASTSAGQGPYSSAIIIKTEEHPPTQYPRNFEGFNTSSYSIRVLWERVSEPYRHGVILGYKLQYKSQSETTWAVVFLLGTSNRSFEINGLNNYTLYDLKVSAYNSKGTGVESNIQVRTDDAIPTLPPESVTARNTSSTTLHIQWQRIPEISRHGVILGYIINYTDLALNTLMTTTIHNWGLLQITLTSLEKFRRYRIDVAGYTRNGVGPYISTIGITDENTPSVFPSDLRGINISATAIFLQWNNSMPILPRNGIITGYRVTYVAVLNPTDNGVVEFHGAALQSGNVTDLHYWTHYNFSIAAGTRIGFGVDSLPITIRTNEHVPTKPPIILTAFNTSSYTVNISWQPIENQFQHGIILGYNVTYTSMFDGSDAYRLVPGQNNLNVEITNLRNFTEYNFTVSGYNIKGTGPCNWVVVKTEETEPIQPPASLLTYNTSSSSLWIEWSKVPFESRRGLILGYMVVYSDIVYNITRNLTLNGENVLSHNLIGLEQFRKYRISIAGFTKIGIGPYISTVGITDQDIPNAAPIEISGAFLSSSEIKILWSQPPAAELNGKLMSVNVFYKIDVRVAPTRAVDGRKYLEMLLAKNSSEASRRKRSVGEENGGIQPELKICESHLNLPCLRLPISHQANKLQVLQSHRARRSSSSLTGFDTITVNANETSLQLNSLDPYINYTIMLQATTIKGSGPLSNPILVQTGETVPSSPPTDVSAKFTSSRSILTKWQPVPYADANGIVYAYIVSIQRANSSDPWQSHIQYEPHLQYNITGLMRFVLYEIRVAAVTSKGIGPFSAGVFEKTDEDIPSASPAHITGESLSSTKLRIKWGSVPENGEPSCCLHGILTGYRVSYGKRYPVPGDSFSTVITPPNQQSVDITDLVTYTPYTIDVAPMTIKGLGPDKRIHMWTSESRPIIEPQNVSLTNHTSTSLLVEWNELPFLKRKGEIRGYAVYYRVKKSSLPLSIKWVDMYHFTANYTVVYRPPIQVEVDDVIRRLWYELTGLYKFMEYTVHLTAYTKVGTGPWTFAKFAMTDEDVPSRAAQNVTVHALNSTSIVVEWDPVPAIYDPRIEDPVCCVNGILTGYTIFYTRERKSYIHNISIDLTYFERMESLLSPNITNNATNATQAYRMSYVLTGLDSYKNYTVYVAGNTRKGHGVLGRPVHVVTQQDLPARGPLRVQAWNTSSTSVRVEWEELDWEYRNGLILYFMIYYRETYKPFQEESAFSVSSKYNYTEIKNLRKWTFYDIRIYGGTYVGRGLNSTNITVRTDTDVPTLPPQDLIAFDNTGPFSLLLTWKPIPLEHCHGDIVTYKILFRQYTEADKEVETAKMSELVLPSDVHQVYIENLSTFSTYEIEIVGATNQGYGIHSNKIYAKTCRCVKNLYTNWWAYPPYLFEEGIDGTKPIANSRANPSYVPKGIFGKLIRDMVVWGCQNCNGPRGHGLSVLHFDVDRTGGRCIKSSSIQCMENVNNATDISFPVLGRALQTNFLSRGKFLHLIDHPSSALVALKKVTIISKSKAMSVAMFSLWPMIILILALAALAGNIIWFLDSGENPEEFPPSSLFVGIWNGLWWAYITMTTVGYGDITPRSFIGRLFAILWTLVGLVIYAILCSGLTSSLYVKEQMIHRKVDIYNNKIATVAGSFEEMLVLKKLGKSVKKNNIEEILQMVRQDQIVGGLVDSFALTMFQSHFNNSPIYVQKSFKSSFAFGIGLTGNISKLDNVFTDFLHSNQKMLAESIVNYVHTFKADESTAVVPEESSGMFQPKSPIFLNMTYAIAACIGVSCIFGSIFTIWRRRKERYLKERGQCLEKLRENCEGYAKLEKLFNSMNEVLENFVMSVVESLAKIDNNHNEQTNHLMNIYRFLDRCERSAVDPSNQLSQHGIFIENWDTVYKERKRLANSKNGGFINNIFQHRRKGRTDPV